MIDLRQQKMNEATQKALDSANAALYESKKARSDQHVVSCTCEDCDFVANYEHDQSILHPVAEPVYVF